MINDQCNTRRKNTKMSLSFKSPPTSRETPLYALCRAVLNEKKKKTRPQTFGRKKGTPRRSGGKIFFAVIPNSDRFHAADSQLGGVLKVRSLTGKNMSPKDRPGASRGGGHLINPSILIFQKISKTKYLKRRSRARHCLQGCTRRGCRTRGSGQPQPFW